MNYLKENTTGIDTPIKGLQVYLYDNIVDSFGLNKFDAYGRVYRNKKNSKVIPEYYVKKKEYKSVLLDDRKDGIMFFSPSDTAQVNGNSLIQDCDILFTVNLSKICCDEGRQDEEFRQRVLFLLNNYTRRQEVTQIQTGLNNVYRDYDGVADYFKDMQSFHHFKITLNIRFSNNNCK